MRGRGTKNYRSLSSPDWTVKSSVNSEQIQCKSKTEKVLKTKKAQIHQYDRL